MRSAIIHRAIAVLKMPAHVPDQIKQGEAISAALVNNPNFSRTDPIIVAFSDALTKYSAAATAAETRAKGTVATRNAAQIVYIGAAHALKARIQLAADANPDQAAAIITSTTRTVKKSPIRQKQAFAVKYGDNSRVGRSDVDDLRRIARRDGPLGARLRRGRGRAVRRERAVERRDDRVRKREVRVIGQSSLDGLPLLDLIWDVLRHVEGGNRAMNDG